MFWSVPPWAAKRRAIKGKVIRLLTGDRDLFENVRIGDAVSGHALWISVLKRKRTGIASLDHLTRRRSRTTSADESQRDSGPKPKVARPCRYPQDPPASTRPERPSFASPGRSPGFRWRKGASPVRAEQLLARPTTSGFALSGLGHFGPSSQGFALGYRIAPRWG